MGFSRNFKFLIGVSGSFILVEFGKVSKLVESSGFFRRRVDISRYFRLIDLSKFSRFWFGVRVVYYRAFLLIIRSSE